MSEQYVRSVNGELVPLTEQEILDRKNEESAFKIKMLEEFIVEYAQSIDNSAFTYQGFTEDGNSDQRRAAKEVVDFLRELGPNAPVQLTWDGTYGPQTVTLQKLLGWLLGVGIRRQKRFTVQVLLKQNIASYNSVEEVRGAFDQMMTTA